MIVLDVVGAIMAMFWQIKLVIWRCAVGIWLPWSQGNGMHWPCRELLDANMTGSVCWMLNKGGLGISIVGTSELARVAFLRVGGAPFDAFVQAIGRSER